jgi:hypothetical protein
LPQIHFSHYTSAYQVSYLWSQPLPGQESRASGRSSEWSCHHCKVSLKISGQKSNPSNHVLFLRSQLKLSLHCFRSKKGAPDPKCPGLMHNVVFMFRLLFYFSPHVGILF